jgi:hypothetical protein
MFGTHEKTSPDTIDHESSASGPDTSRLAISALALVLVAAGGWFALQESGGDDAAATIGRDCTTQLVTIAVAPAMVDVVDQAVAALPDTGRCVEFDLVTATVADVAQAQDEVDEGDADVIPDLWVPDSPAWQSVLTKSGRTGKVLAPALATTPVALAGGRTDLEPVSWLRVMASPRLVMSDPNIGGASAMAVLSAFAEGDPVAAQARIVPVAQQFGDDVASGTVGTLSIDNLEAGSDKLLPVTEQDFLIAQRGNAALQWIAPDTGVGLLDFPLVQPSAGGRGLGVNTGSLDVAGRTGERLATWFTTEEGVSAISEALLRGADGAPLPDGQSISNEVQLATVEKGQVDAVIRNWNNLVVATSVLALVETSNSMDNVFGTKTRIQLAVDAAKTALQVFPDGVRLGLRSFSTNQGPNGQDWRELAPLRRLDSPLGKGETQIDLVTRAADSLPSKTRGGSGLYDSILAAYQETARHYNPYYQNALVIFSDGPNEDPGSISLAELKRELRALYNPERPVRIIAIGVSDSADIASLQEIASTADESAAYLVLEPEDILVVLSAALLSRA